ncbi:MAG TPA: sigma 54-interacting transcriptional regulator [Gemmataceae bacterium]|nr:sigma 54-interacting transcriptional regulator [Gemmataceae bacterium]
MNGPRLALIADDQRLAGGLLSHLEKALGLVLWQCSFEGIRRYPPPESDGLFLLASSSAADSEQVRRLVQEIYLQKLPIVCLVVETEAARAGRDLSRLDAYIARRLLWSAEATLISQFVHDRAAHIPHATAMAEETIDEVVRRRLLSQTPSLMPLVERITIAAQHEVTVLLTGETGTGKTFLARLMHECSPRRAHPFLVVPCGAQPPNLLESAFFGHVRGAFTGADRPKVGKFEAAGEGTILLDEIDTIPLEQQAGLLRVIESGEFEPVGGNEVKHCKARIIVASNWDLEEAVQQGKFRQDLYYRLNVMSFHLPPLRERVQDIAPLLRSLTARFNTKFHKELFDLSPRALEALENFPWPGNIRQLENIVQQAVLVSSGPELLWEHLPDQLRQFQPAERVVAVPVPARDTLVHNREALERNVIQRALAKNGYSRSRAAMALGISRVTLYKKMKKYGLMRGPLGTEEA